MKQALAVVICCLFALASPAMAQTYKCNIGGKSVYTDTPCGSGARVVHDGNSSSQAFDQDGPVGFGAQLCREAIPKHVAWKDPESLRVGSTTGGTMVVIDFANTKVGARSYSVSVNSKNTYGAYTGDRPVKCYTSQDGRRILRLEGIEQ